jgi:tetratricopeptide (TPR) repeat protein
MYNIFLTKILTKMSELIDQKEPDLEIVFNYNKPLNPAHKTCNIILNLMIKNEEKIIERCLTRCMNFVDAICILDTGSTDTTVNTCINFLNTFQKPFKIQLEPFKNFGHNRSTSFKNCQVLCSELNWDPEKTYAICIDADMNVVPSEIFRSLEMNSNGYSLIQTCGGTEYHNTRLLKISYPWKCVGSTHEFWDGGPIEKIPKEFFFIDDKNDGGCKSDKFARDVRFLSDEVLEDPNNSRAHFYLARSLQALGHHKAAIIHFKEVIRLDGWNQEVWYSHYEIGKCYKDLNKEEHMEMWMNKGFNFYPTRAETIYYLCRYFREKGQHHKAYHYYLKGRNIPYPSNDILFIESNVYKGLFEYEHTIMCYYVYGKSRQEGLNDYIQYINKPIPFNLENVWNNMHFFIETLTGSTYHAKYTKLNFPDYKEYVPSSSSLLPCNDGTFLLNIRYVNYIVNPNGSYTMRSPDGKVKTTNKMITLDSNYNPITESFPMEEKIPIRYESNIEGLEDIRLFNYENRVYFSASVKNLNPDGRIEIAVGQYDTKYTLLHDINVVYPPEPTRCEKNWIFVPNNYLTNLEAKGKMNFIYKWHPLQICSVNDNKLNIHTSFNTPKFFDRFRGSSNICEYKGKLWTVVHFVKYSIPRVYYHSVVQFDTKNMRPEKYSLPFCFRNRSIEYCLGFNIRDDGMCFVVSENDSNPCIITVPINMIGFISL